MPAAEPPVPDWLGPFFDEQYLATFGQLLVREDAECEALAAASAARVVPGERVLDAACGYGRHAIPLAAAGFAVVGLDRSPALLAEARRRATGVEGLELVEADYRSVPFPDGTFAAVLCLYNSFGYLGEDGDLSALVELRRVLAPGRRLVLAAAHRDRIVQTFRPRTWSRLPDGSRLLEEAEFDAVAGTLSVTLTQLASGGEARRSYRVRAYTATELVALATRAGFSQVALAGGLDGARFDVDSRELVLVATW